MPCLRPGNPRSAFPTLSLQRTSLRPSTLRRARLGDPPFGVVWSSRLLLSAPAKVRGAESVQSFFAGPAASLDSAWAWRACELAARDSSFRKSLAKPFGRTSEATRSLVRSVGEKRDAKAMDLLPARIRDPLGGGCLESRSDAFPGWLRMRTLPM